MKLLLTLMETKFTQIKHSRFWALHWTINWAIVSILVKYAKVGLILRLRNLIPSRAIKLELYKSSILAHLTYCHTVWHLCKASDKRQLERVQERALRAIFNSKSDSYEELLLKAKLPSLYKRRLQDIIILMHKVKKSISPDYVNIIFEVTDK